MKLNLDCISKSYSRKQVLKKINFTFESGNIYGLIGRNGVGKTTLFECLSGSKKSDSGAAYIDINNNKRLISPFDVGYMSSVPILPEFLTGQEFLDFIKDANEHVKCSVDEYFDMVKIEKGLRTDLIKNYSHGTKNKIQMLSLIISKPAIILLDEPFTSLDIVVALEIKEFLRNIKKDHIIIFSTHILQLALDLCNELVILNDGTLERLDPLLLKDINFENKILEILRGGDTFI